MYKYEFILAFQYVWISILDTEANYWFIFIWFFDPAPTLSVQFIVDKIPDGDGSN